MKLSRNISRNISRSIKRNIQKIIIKSCINTFTALLVLSLASCQIAERKTPANQRPPADATFENAVVYFRKGEYQKSLDSIENYLKAYPQTTKLVESYYLKGRNQRFLKYYTDCIETFQILLELTKFKKDSYYNYSLYQSGLCLEMISEIEKAIAVYQDALRAPKSLPAQLKDLEIPSRLALCYSRLGEKQASEKYYNQLQNSLKAYLNRADFNIEEKEFYAEILFSMSALEIPLQDQQDFDAILRSLEINQTTLIQLLKFNLEPYTQKALTAYISNYEALHEYLTRIQVIETADPVLSERNKQQIQKKMALQVLENMEALETVLVPETLQSTLQPQFENLKRIKNKFENMALQKMSGEGLTPEAQRQQSLKREGQVFDRKTILEEKAEQKMNQKIETKIKNKDEKK